MVDRFRIGVVTSPHGVHGEFKVFPTTEDPSRFKKLKTVLVQVGKTETEKKVTSIKFVSNMVVVGIEGCTTVEDAQKLRGAELLVDRDHALKLEDGQYYVPDLIGLPVFKEDGESVGVLEEVLQTGANDVYSVRTPQGKQLLLPVIPECILKVDLEKGITVFVMPGLEDL